LEEVLGADAHSHYERILRNPRGSQKEDVPQDITMCGVEFVYDGFGRSSSKNANPNNSGLEASTNVTGLFLRQHAQAAELFAEHAEQEITTRQAKLAAEKA
jgi:hypothetical protein